LYSYDVRDVFEWLLDIGLANMQDPMGISGLISPCSSDAKKENALSKLETAYGRAVKAVKAESDGNISDAFYWWNLVFDEKFPAFG
jgi:hypothetical protein